LAIWGAIHPMSWFIAWFNENGYSLAGMLEAWHVNAATSGLVWDLTIAAVALTVLERVDRDPCDLLHWRQLRAAIVPVSSHKTRKIRPVT